MVQRVFTVKEIFQLGFEGFLGSRKGKKRKHKQRHEKKKAHKMFRRQ